MAIKLQYQSFVSLSPSESWLSRKPNRIHFLRKEVTDPNHLLYDWGNSMQKCHIRHTLLEYDKRSYSCRLIEFGKHCPNFFKARRMNRFLPLASADDGVTVDGNPRASTSSDIEEMRVKLNQSLQGEDYGNGLIQSLHDAARVYELAIKEQSSLSNITWFSTAWLGVDKNAWVKALSYQAAIYSLLQAVIEISSRGDGRDRDINIFVQKSLLRLSAPLESIIRDKLPAKLPDACEWFWSEQLPMVVTTFVNYFERDPQFAAVTTIFGKGVLLGSGNSCDISLLMLALTCVAAIMKLGPAKVSCSQFFSMLPDITGRLMDMMVDFVPIWQAYQSMNDIGLRREFLVHFGPRAAACRIKNDQGTEEVSFWVELVQKQLQQAIDRERIWSRLTTCESIEKLCFKVHADLVQVLEKDLSIFGFFIALGRSTQSYLYANGYDVIDGSIEGFIRYLIGGSVLYYPQLSSISSYQMYVEVVCEELDWLPFYPGTIGKLKHSQDHKSKRQGRPNAEAVPQVLDVCSYWIQSFIKYSKWLEDPSNIKAARFLSRGHNKLGGCMEDLGILKNRMRESNAQCFGAKTESGTSSSEKELDSFDKALESVEEALKRLEELLQELHVSRSNSEKEHLKAACSDLEKIRKLKKEAEFLEASFRAKAASLQQSDDDGHAQSSIGRQRQYLNRQSKKSVNVIPGRSKRDDIPAARVVGNRRGLWSFLVRYPAQKIGLGSSNSDRPEDEAYEHATNATMGDADSESNEIRRFELLRTELIELEKRVQRSTDQPENDEDLQITYDSGSYKDEAGDVGMVQEQTKESIFAKSIDKLKETTTDVWQGTQLLAIDTVAATGLLTRALIGDELTMKEKNALRRTLTDLASVVPIGILMLLPVTAVGHAAILAAIQRYVPALIPSTYGPERLDLLRQLEKVKEMEASEMDPDEDAEGNSPNRSSPDNI